MSDMSNRLTFGLVTVAVLRRSNVRFDAIGQGEVVAYYADSFGQRPDRYGESSSLDDSVATSYSQLKMAILNHRLPDTGGSIRLLDVSVNQQEDLSSCGVYDLENAHR